MQQKFRHAQEIASWRLCIGCGVCHSICPKNNILLKNIPETGIRPFVNAEICGDCRDCVNVCPGIFVKAKKENGPGDVNRHVRGDTGPVLELWEGFASDETVRIMGSSGGLASALALYCLEQEGMGGVLHISGDPAEPWQNRTVMSSTRADILRTTGSRYAPASPGDGLKRIIGAPAPCVFIGKPCDVAGLENARTFDGVLDKKVGVSIGIFCAGTPSTAGTLDYIAQLQVNLKEIEEIRYRGQGWPGSFSIRLKGSRQETIRRTYKESWGFLQKYRPFRCYLCPDGTSECADISCGDPWYRERSENEKGHSLVMARTERGRRIVQRAMEKGYVSLERSSPDILVKSQRNLLEKRGEIWGRFFTMRLFGVPTPRYSGFSLFKAWLRTSPKDKLRSLIGTARRIVKRGYTKPEITKEK